MDNTPLISVIIPVYNVEKFLPQCIESVLNQTYTNLEIILVNDGSTDSSGELCDKIALTDKRVNVIHKENGGLSSARNCGLQIVTGDYICFLDSDDWMEVNTLYESVKIAIQYNSDIVFWSFTKEFKTKRINYQVFNSTHDFEVFEGNSLEKLKLRCVGLIKEELKNPTKTDSFISAWAKLYKTSLIRDNKIDFISTALVGSEDVPFNIEAFHYCKKVIFINKYYNHYRMVNENSLTKNHKNTLFIRFKKLYHHIDGFLKAHNASDDYYRALNNRFALSLINNCLSISSPRYDVSLNIKFNDIKSIIYDDDYYFALCKLEYTFLPIIWKVFFLLARYRCYRTLLIMTIIYRKLVKYVRH